MTTALLHAVEPLIGEEDSSCPFSAVIERLRQLFAFDEALLLEEDADGFACVLSSRSALVGLRWSPGALFRDVAGGRVHASWGHHGLGEWRDIPNDLIMPSQPALYLPDCIQ